MKITSSLLFILLAFTTTPKNEVETKPFVIVQLFTSQGCSSCPPADKLVEKVKDEYKNQNVFVMSYHVDYWDRLGWKDPFSQRKFTEIQYQYATQFRERNVYTPQIVVNGKENFVGSNGSKLRNRIKSYLKHDSKNSIQLSSSRNKKGDYILNYTVSGDLKNKKLKLAIVLNKHITSVKRGENRNRTLTNSNIVLDENSIELHLNKKGSITLPKSYFKENKELKIIGFVQKSNLEITGATFINL